MRAAVIQMNSKHDIDSNLERASALIDQAVSAGAEFVVLPEYMTYCGSVQGYSTASETIPGRTSALLAAKARQHKIYLHSGSLLEKSPDPQRVYNTSLVFNPQGELIAYYRKIHLFDIDIPGKVTEKESKVILPGDRLAICEVGEFKLGLTICFDVRFAGLYNALAVLGAEIFAVPAAFAKFTGESHWEILLRGRAIENHAYVLAAAQCSLDGAGTPHYGYSMIVDPWGTVLGVLPKDEGFLVAELDRDAVLRYRSQIPVLTARRPDIYQQVI